MNLSSNEKQLIAWFSDLLDQPLSQQECVELGKLVDAGDVQADRWNEYISDELINKLHYLNGQAFRLGNELEKLNRRGVQIKFEPYLTLPSAISHRLLPQIPFIFLCGHETLLNEHVPVIESLRALKKHSPPSILIADRSLDELLRKRLVSDKIENKELLIVSNRIKSKAMVVRSKNDELDNQLEKDLSSSDSRKSVFISGSRSFSKIPEEIQHSLKKISEAGFQILIGDSDKGIDKVIIDYYRLNLLYPHVHIYTIGKYPRVEIPDEWKYTSISVSDSNKKPQEQQMEKDRVMGNLADYGLAIFHPVSKNKRFGHFQVSSGTLRNTIQLLMRGKSVKFFYVYDKKIQYKALKNLSDLEGLLKLYENEPNVSETYQAKDKGEMVEKEFTNIKKYELIRKKYDELLKKEKAVKDLINSEEDRQGQAEEEENLELFSQEQTMDKENAEQSEQEQKAESVNAGLAEQATEEVNLTSNVQEQEVDRENAEQSEQKQKADSVNARLAEQAAEKANLTSNVQEQEVDRENAEQSEQEQKADSVNAGLAEQAAGEGSLELTVQGQAMILEDAKKIKKEKRKSQASKKQSDRKKEGNVKNQVNQEFEQLTLKIDE
ncbi:hypothetical protein [Basilea psittacipulmonis]|uniref:hypothetical protein n=1 Tax=Basilea psittacipulmonis TaxID=1472345 RepID=UPI0006895CB9|nr:hypothetical protein [Basilea psittacipulmonis]